MTDEVIKELWTTKDNVAKEHGYSIDRLAEYFFQKQSARRGRSYQDGQGMNAEQGATADARTSRG